MEGADATTSAVLVSPGDVVSNAVGLVTKARLSVYGATTGQSFVAIEYD